MHNPRITKKERGLIKGALRRVFSRSDLRRQAIQTARTDHTDERRPRVGKWGVCAYCGEVTPLYLMQVDHKSPVVQIGETLEHMSWDLLVNRLWCEPENLVPTCQPCHKRKSALEAKQRKRVRDVQKRKVG